MSAVLLAMKCARARLPKRKVVLVSALFDALELETDEELRQLMRERIERPQSATMILNNAAKQMLRERDELDKLTMRKDSPLTHGEADALKADVLKRRSPMALCVDYRVTIGEALRLKRVVFGRDE